MLNINGIFYPNSRVPWLNLEFLYPLGEDRQIAGMIWLLLKIESLLGFNYEPRRVSHRLQDHYGSLILAWSPNTTLYTVKFNFSLLIHVYTYLILSELATANW